MGCSLQFALGQGIKTTFYDAAQTQKKEIFSFDQKKKNQLKGPYQFFYQSGQLKIEGNFDKNEKDGKWVFYYENGNSQQIGFYDKGKNTGFWTYFYENGNKKSTGYWKNDVKDSLWTFYFENGQVSSTGTFKNGIQDQDWTYFFEDGKVKSKVIFEDGAGWFSAYYPNGELEMQGLMRNGLADSLWTYFYPNGQIKARGIEKNGKKEGEWVYFYDDGIVSATGVYVKDKQVGHWKYFYPNQKVSAEGDLEEGVKNGRWVSYFEFGGMKGESMLSKGEGVYKEYYPSGALKVEGFVKNDKNEGAWKYFYENGALEGECNFVAGEGWYKGYAVNGKLKMEGLLKDGNKVGSWKIYDKDQEVAGFYKSFYEKDAVKLPNPAELKDTTEKVIPKKEVVSQPKIKKRKIKFFNPSLNVYNSFILSTNPLAPLNNIIPVYLELYKEEKYGLEVGYMLKRNPILGNGSTTAVNKITLKGATYLIRYKDYFKNSRFGMRYWGYEMRFESDDYQANVLEDAIVTSTNMEKMSLAYTFYVGDRFLKHTDKSGFTFDVYAGLGLGYRMITNNFKFTIANSPIFGNASKEGIYIPVRVAFTVGYVF